MANSDYIPSTDDGLNTFAAGILAAVTGAETDYGFTEETLTTEIQILKTDFTTKLATHNATKTSARTASADKTDARSLLVKKLREKIQQMQVNPNVSDAMIAALGLTPRDRIPSRIAAPLSTPVLRVDFSQRGQHTIRATDSAILNSKRKPSGAAGFALYLKVGGTQPADKSTMEYIGNVTAASHTLNFEESQYGQTAYYVAAWVTAKGEQGATGDFTSATIAK